jgi:hypothetical protein
VLPHRPLGGGPQVGPRGVAGEVALSPGLTCRRFDRGSMFVIGGVDGTGEFLTDIYRTYREDEAAAGAGEGEDPAAFAVEDDRHTMGGEDTVDWVSARSDYETASFFSSDMKPATPPMSSVIAR